MTAGVARAGEGVAEPQAGTASPRARRLDLTLAWPEPPGGPARLPVPGPAVPAALPTAGSQPAGVNGGQVLSAVLVSAAGLGLGFAVAADADSVPAGLGVALALAPFAVGGVVCALGDGRAGRCRGSIVGALIGAAVGLLPAALILAGAGSAPAGESDYHDWVQDQLGAALVGSVGFLIGAPTGAALGYGRFGRGALPPPPPAVGVPSAAPADPFGMTAAAPVFTLHF